MARVDDYRTNNAGHISPYDIILDNYGFNFWGSNPLRGKFGPGKTTAEGGEGETPLIFNDYSNGMGMAYSGIPNTYAFAINGYTRTPRKFMPGGRLTEISLTDLAFNEEELGGEIKCAMEWLGDLYIGAGHHIIKIPFGTGDPEDDYDVGEDCQIDSCLVYNNIPLFSTDPEGVNWQYLTGYDIGDAAWKTAQLTGDPANGSGNPVYYDNPVFLQKMAKLFQEVEGVGGNRIVGNDTGYTYVQTQTTDFDTLIGDTTAWSSSYSAGDTTYSITGIYPTNRIFYITKADGVYGIESSGLYCPNFVPDLGDALSVDNGISGKFFNGKLYVGTPQGVLMLDVNDKQRIDVPTFVSPSFYFANETPVYGLPTYMETDNGWLVVSLYNGRDSHVVYTRPRDATIATIPNPMIWHGSECTIPGERITMLFKSSLSGRPIMWIGTHDGTRMHLYTLSLPDEGDPYTDYFNNKRNGLPTHEFSIESRLYLPFQDAEDANAKKVIRRFDVQAEGLTFPVIAQEDVPEDGILAGDVTATTHAAEISFYANADAGSRIFFEDVDPDDPISEWVFQGVVSDSPKATMIPATGTTSGSQIGTVLVCTLINQESDVNLDPIYSPFAVRSVKIRTDVVVEQMLSVVYTFGLGEYSATKTGRNHNDMQTLFTALAAMQDADVIYMIDHFQERVLAKVDPGITFNIKQERLGQEPSLVAEVGVTFLGRQFYYDIGQPYDSVYSWGG